MCIFVDDETYHDCSSTIDRITSNARLAPPASLTSGISYSRPISPSPADTLEEFYDDHPLVNFWHKSDWVTFQETEKAKPTDPAKGDAQKDSTARYIEDGNGECVSAATLKEIRKTARRVWAMFKERGEAPAQWSKASSKVVNAYRLEMRRQHPELRLCANDWKSEALATQAYPSWYQNHCKSSIKAEEEAPTAATRPSHKKRRRHGEIDESKEYSQEKAAKKQKTLDDKPSGTDNADDGGGFSVGEGSNDTNRAIDSFTRKGEEPGPSDELKRNPAVSSEPGGSLFWVCYIIFVVMHTMLTIGPLDGITRVPYLVRCVILLSKILFFCDLFSLTNTSHREGISLRQYSSNPLK